MRLATHVQKVHNKKSCGKCPFLADDQHQLAAHLRDSHHVESRNLKVPINVGRAPGGAAGGVFPASGVQLSAEAGAGGAAGAGGGGGAGGRRRAAGAARLFGYLEASDGSGDEYEAAPLEYGAGYARDKENAAPLHHDHCLRY